MGLLTNLLFGVVHLGVVAIDVLFLCLLVRMLSLKWPLRGLLAFNTLSQPMVDWFISHIDRIAQRAGSRSLAEPTVLFVGMVALAAFRLVVVGLCTGWL